MSRRLGGRQGHPEDVRERQPSPGLGPAHLPAVSQEEKHRAGRVLARGPGQFYHLPTSRARRLPSSLSFSTLSSSEARPPRNPGRSLRVTAPLLPESSSGNRQLESENRWEPQGPKRLPPRRCRDDSLRDRRLEGCSRVPSSNAAHTLTNGPTLAPREGNPPSLMLGEQVKARAGAPHPGVSLPALAQELGCHQAASRLRTGFGVSRPRGLQPSRTSRSPHQPTSGDVT